jgi:type I restriction enzyme S subunit
MNRELPTGWEWKRLDDVAKYINGRAFKPSEWGNTGRPIIRIQNLTDDLKSFNYFNGECEQKYSIKNGDILISWSASLGIFVWGEGDAVLNQHIFKAIPDEKIIDRRFFIYVIQTVMEDMKRKTHGSTMKHIVKSEFNKIKIPIPPLEMQCKIVTILEKVEAAKKIRAQSDELTNKLLQSIFLEMFGDPLKNPKEWKIKTIQEICERITDGEHVTPQRTDRGIYLLSARNIHNHKIVLDDVDFIGGEEYERICKRITPQKGDVLISCSGTVGRVARVKAEFKFQLVRSVALIRPITTLVHPIFLEYIFDTNFMKGQIEKAINQSSQANLFQGKIRKLSLPLPPLQLQQKFTQIVEKFEVTQEVQKQSQQQINNLANKLIQIAFTGGLVA